MMVRVVLVGILARGFLFNWLFREYNLKEEF